MAQILHEIYKNLNVTEDPILLFSGSDKLTEKRYALISLLDGGAPASSSAQQPEFVPGDAAESSGRFVSHFLAEAVTFHTLSNAPPMGQCPLLTSLGPNNVDPPPSSKTLAPARQCSILRSLSFNPEIISTSSLCSPSLQGGSSFPQLLLLNT